MYEDTPDELIHDLFIKTFYQDHPLGQPVIGVSTTIKGFNREKIMEFFLGHYLPERVVIVVAGGVKTHEFLKKAEELFGRYKAQPSRANLSPPKIQPRLFGQERSLEQIHFCLGTEGLPYTSKDRFILSILNTILGGSMSSRLFEEIREKRGLAYSVYSYQNSFRCCGLFVVYVGTSPETYYQTIEIILKEFTRLKEEEVSQKELKKAKEHIKGGLILSLEDTEARMSRLAKQEIYFNRYIPIDEILQEIDRVTSVEIQELANKLFRPQSIALASIGPLSRRGLEGIDLTC